MGKMKEKAQKLSAGKVSRSLTYSRQTDILVYVGISPKLPHSTRTSVGCEMGDLPAHWGAMFPNNKVLSKSIVEKHWELVCQYVRQL